MNTKTKPEETQAIAVMQGQAETLIAKAIDRNVSVETMEKLLAMRRELQAEWSRRRFDEAMAAFQAEYPVIEKTRKVDFTSKRTGNRTTYAYAPLDAIVKQVKDILGKFGFSYTIETENTETKIVSKVTAKHIDGHSETTRFEVPIDKEAYMNAQQQYGAASTFSKRYAFCNAFGILTGDEDTDADGAQPAKPDVSDQTAEADNGRKAGSARQNGGTATPAQVNFIQKLLRQKGRSDDEICLRFDVTDLKELTISEASYIIDRLKQLSDVREEHGDDGYRASS